MCQGFGLIVTNDLKAYFVEPDSDGDVSHSEILRRLNLDDNTDQFMRRFVRVEFPFWTAESFRFDENETLPGWVENSKEEIQSICTATLEKCAPALAEYRKVNDAAWAEYEKVRDAALAEYEKVCDAALAEYLKVFTPAWAEKEKVCDAAWANMIDKMSKVTGYVAKG